MNRKHLIQLAVGILISAVALYFVFQGVSIRDLIASFKSVDYVWLIWCLVVFYFSVLLRGLRWRWLFKPKHDVSLTHATGGIFICFAFNSIFPARLGEFARAYIVVKQDKMGFSTAFGTVVAERLLDVIVLILSLLACLAVVRIDPDAELTRSIFKNMEPITVTGAQFLALKNKMLFMGIALTIGILAISIPRSRGWFLTILHAMKIVPHAIRDKIEHMVHQFAEGLASLRSPGRAAALIVLSFVIWTTNALSTLFLALGFPFTATMTFPEAFALVIIICIFITVPAAPGYWGFFEAGVIFAIFILGIHDPNAPLVLSFAILLHLSQWIPIVAVGLPWAWLSHVSLDEVQAAEETTH